MVRAPINEEGRLGAGLELVRPDRLEDLVTHPLNARERCGDGLCRAVVAEDVVRTRGDSVEAHGIRDDAGNRLRFGLADRIRRPLVRRKLLVQELVR